MAQGQGNRPPHQHQHNNNQQDQEQVTAKVQPLATIDPTSTQGETVSCEEDTPLTLARTICLGLIQVMEDRKHMVSLEASVDYFMKNCYTRTSTSRKEVEAQMTNAKLALESLYNRVISQA